MKSCVKIAVAVSLFVYCKEVLAQENQDYMFFIPVLFQYGDCDNPNMLQELLLHLATQSLNTSQHYTYYYYGSDNYLAYEGSFHSPDAAVLISKFTPPDGTYQIPEKYCERHNTSGITVIIGKVPDIAGVAILRAPRYIQELFIAPINADVADETLESYQYYLLYGTNEPGEIDGFAIGSIYSNTRLTIEISEDLLLVRNGGQPSRIVVHSNMGRELTIEPSLSEMLWFEVAAEDCNSGAERLIGTHITTNKPIAVYAAKAECASPLQFSFAAHILNEMPPLQKWGETLIGDVTAFQSLNGYIITLHILCATDSIVHITWYQGHSNTTTTDTPTLYGGILHRVSKSQSNTTHFTIHSEQQVLVLYEIHSYNHITGIVEQYSSVLLQPVEWFSNVQSVYQYLPTQPNQIQHISLTVNKEHFDPSAIQLVAISDSNGSYAFQCLEEYEDNYILYDLGDYYLLYFNITSIGHQLTLHTIRHIDNPCAEMGATVYSYGDSRDSRVSYSNGYFARFSCGMHPKPTIAHPTETPSSTPPTTYNATKPSLFSDAISPPATSKHDSYTTKSSLGSDAPRPSATSNLGPYKTKPSLFPSVPSITNEHDSSSTNSLPHPITSPLLTTPQHDLKKHSNVDILTAGMGAMAGGLFVLLVLTLLMFVGCWLRRKKTQGRTSYHMHDMFPRYSRIEEPPEAGYDFDVFLSFADEDREFVERNIYSPLRQKGYSVLWHHEDFVPGLSIGDNICNAIDRSRRIVFVCTEDFSKSNFCAMELRYSLVKQHSEGVRCIIPIVFEEEHCPRELQGLNQVKLSSRHEDLEEEEIETIISRLALGDPLDLDDKPTETIQWIHDIDM